MQPIEDFEEEIVGDDDDYETGNDPEFAVEPVSESGPTGGPESVDIVDVDSDNDDDYLVEDDPSPSQAEEHSGGAVVPQMGGETGSSRVDESGTAVSSEATTSHQVGQFEDAGDDSVVPSTPKLSAGSGSETVTSQVPTFMFQSATNPEAIGGTSVSGASGTGSTTFGALAAQASSSTSGQSGVKGASQEGIDRTSVDILQFTGGSAATGASTTSTPTGFAAASAPTGFAALAQMAPTKPLFGGSSTPTPSLFAGAGTAASPLFAGSGAPVFGGSSAPLFGGPASISKPTASSTSPGTSTGSGGLFSTKSPTQQTAGSTPAVAESKPETELGSAEAAGQFTAANPEVGTSASGASGTTPEPVGQPIESLSRPRIDRGPRLTRTPIVWGQPTGSSSASQPGSAAGTQATTAPTVPQIRGRGVA